MTTESRWVRCDDCREVWRHPDPECAEHFAEYHREAFGHSVNINPPVEEEVSRSIRTLFQQPRLQRWWEE